MNYSHKSVSLDRARIRRTISVLVVSAGLAGLVLFASSRPASAQTSSTVTTQSTPSNIGPRTITARGAGSVSVVPDRLILSIGVQTIAPGAGDALKANNISAQGLISVLKSKGIAVADIQTSQVSIQPQFDTTGRRVTSYQVSNSVTVTVRKIDTTGDLIDAASKVAGDAIRVGGLNFTVSDPSIPLSGARDLAVKDATKHAEQLAKAAGVKLGRVRAIRSDEANGPSPMYREGASAVSDAPPVLEGSQEITASVELVFDIQE